MLANPRLSQGTRIAAPQGIAGRAHRLLYEKLWKRPVNAVGARGMVTFSFDDFSLSAFDCGAVVLERYGWRATYYVAPGLLGSETSLGRQAAASDLARCAAAGHEIGSHTFDHVNCCEHDDDTVIANCRSGSDALAAYGARNFAWPFGAANLRAKRLVGGLFDSCRGIQPGINGNETDLNELKANAIYSHRGLDSLLRLIELNRSERGWLIFYTHDVCAQPSAFGATPEDLARLTHAVGASGMDVVTVRAGLCRVAAA